MLSIKGVAGVIIFWAVVIPMFYLLYTNTMLFGLIALIAVAGLMVVIITIGIYYLAAGDV